MKIKTISVAQMQALDKLAIEKYGVPSAALMENAGRAAAQEVFKIIKKQKRPSACIVCGSGNNAGDGFVIARHLINYGACVNVLLIGSHKKLKNDAAVNYKILKKCKVPVTEIKGINKAAEKIIKECDIIVDAIFGTGLTRDILDPYKSIIDALNKSKKRIVSVDIPSGLDGTTGDIHGVCIKAFRTVTFAYAKKGFYLKNGPGKTGRVIVVDIGIPKKIIKEL